ncbi:exopolysaccharide biosynthesis protein [Bosea sp. (in: a-proteobacteria)]|uniref:exopolysaccharide biosynthesis protein n=1 Tax=Bosea sp. (in: a-proteobacteria) TaxID=1871050 RepID=UPI0012146EC0|nr:exopolysaccharide biosynthesis protein [Bosea sp. (in: a-proteobacteria)]TAJ30071.1 MAG: exopolysaccharide biosynthesis protein [Bosea sp. (in: a-proteobacteria)]
MNPAQEPVSATLSQIGAILPPKPRLRDLFDALGERASGMILAVIAIPAVVPSPGLPVGMVFGAALVLVAMGMVFGAQKPRLPTLLGKVRLSGNAISLLETRGTALLRKLERHMKPRAAGLLTAPLVRALGLVGVLMGVLIALPIPFGNTLPGLSVLLMGLGLAARDGLAVLGSVILAIVATGVSVVLGWAGYWAAAQWIGQ